MSFTQLLKKSFLATMPLCAIGTALAASVTGPSSSQTPYLVPLVPNVDIVSVLTVGDSVNPKPDGTTPYRLVGIPDGLGLYENEDGQTFSLLVNHELTGGVGAPRAHGKAGAFVSRWVLDKDSLQVVHGEDLIQNVFTWSGSVYSPGGGPMSRFCSADLAPRSAWYDKKSGLGYRGQIFMNGEESGVEGRAFAHFLDGNSYELPSLGKFSWENSVANGRSGVKTVVVGTDDGTGGQVYVYVGTKKHSSNPVEAAGLSGGTLYGISVDGVTAENALTGIPARSTFKGVSLGNVTSLSGAQLEQASVSAGITSFLRPEDGCWDPDNLRDFYFVTTASFTGYSRLWRLRFVDPTRPELGGRIDMLLDGTEGQKMMDNITVSHGKVIICEDVGGNTHIGKVWLYDIERDTMTAIAQHDPARFVPGGAGFLTIDEESSGVIPAEEMLGDGWFLIVVQAHYGTDAELVEGGQILAIHIGEQKEK